MVKTFAKFRWQLYQNQLESDKCSWARRGPGRPRICNLHVAMYHGNVTEGKLHSKHLFETGLEPGRGPAPATGQAAVSGALIVNAVQCSRQNENNVSTSSLLQWLLKHYFPSKENQVCFQTRRKLRAITQDWVKLWFLLHPFKVQHFRVIVWYQICINL